MLKGRSVSAQAAAIACVGCLAIGAGTAALADAAAAGAASEPTGPTIKPGPPFKIAGYGYSCESTARTPMFECDWGKPYGPAGTPILTVARGERALVVQSLDRPSITRGYHEWVTTFKK